MDGLSSADPREDLYPDSQRPTMNSGKPLRGGIVQLDDHLKQLLRELGHAINDTVSESGRISEAISDVRAAGFDIVLKLDATIGLARRDGDDTKITTNDRRFLESLHIQVDQEILNEERETPKFEMTPQDLRFLKSLKITLEDAQ